MGNGVLDNPIQLDRLSDRELLVLAVNAINELKIEMRAQSSRVTSLERWRYLLTGGLILMSALIGWKVV